MIARAGDVAPAPDAEARTSLAIFSVLWAAGAIFHLAKWSLWAKNPASVALTAAAAFVILHPGRLLPLAALFAAQVWLLAVDMPHAPNHLVLSGLVGALGFLALTRPLGRRTRPEPVEFFRVFAPPARAIVLVVFVVAAFHKLNADWFDPAVSCGSELWATVARRIPFLPDAGWARAGAIGGGLLLEAAAPILLLPRRFRLLGLAAAWTFLFLVGVAGFFNFAAIAGALVFLFAPANPRELAAAARLRWPALARLEAVARSEPVRRVLRLAPPIVAATAIIVALSHPWAGRVADPILVRGVGSGTRQPISHVFEVLWTLLAPLAALALALGLRAGRPRWPPARDLLAHPAPALAVVPLLALLAGVSPYLGLRSEGAFAMFSNLRTEAGSNHLIVRRPVDLLGMQSDLVRVQRSSDPELRRIVEHGYLLPWLELREYVVARTRATGPDFSIGYVRRGRAREVASAGRDPELTRRPPFLVRELVVFRPVWIGGGNPCRH